MSFESPRTRDFKFLSTLKSASDESLIAGVMKHGFGEYLDELSTRGRHRISYMSEVPDDDKTHINHKKNNANFPWINASLIKGKTGALPRGVFQKTYTEVCLDIMFEWLSEIVEDSRIKHDFDEQRSEYEFRERIYLPRTDHLREYELLQAEDDEERVMIQRNGELILSAEDEIAMVAKIHGGKRTPNFRSLAQEINVDYHAGGEQFLRYMHTKGTHKKQDRFLVKISEIAKPKNSWWCFADDFENKHPSNPRYIENVEVEEYRKPSPLKSAPPSQVGTGRVMPDPSAFDAPVPPAASLSNEQHESALSKFLTSREKRHDQEHKEEMALRSTVEKMRHDAEAKTIRRDKQDDVIIGMLSGQKRPRSPEKNTGDGKKSARKTLSFGLF